jgi:uncharacterized membrane protein HdeD (DUF308 family)
MSRLVPPNEAKEISPVGSALKVSEIEQRIEQQFGLSRGLLLAVGIGCLGLGVLAIALPLSLFGSFIRLVGVLLLGSGGFKAVQLLLGRRSPSARRRAWPVIVLQVAIDVVMGLLLLNNWRASVHFVTIFFGLLFLLEGSVLLYMALRAPTVSSRSAISVSGVIMVAVGLVIVTGLVTDPLRWAGVFVGIKLLLFGASVTWIALRALRSDTVLLYEAETIIPQTGELYAVYFGTAFHLGVSIGNGEIVHYLNDNHVYRVTWEQFLEGRSPEHWTYPDLESIPVELVVSTALSEVGKTYEYSLLRFNCEHFAIYCKTGGKSRYSKYAQIAGGVETLQAHPILGLIAELNTRAVEWLAFHLGGPAGKRLSLSIRRIGASVTNWLISTGRPVEDAGRPD